jgi:hypothetical protein
MSWPPNPTKVCTIDGCEEKHVGRGLCHRHLKRWRRTGDPGPAGLLPKGRKPTKEHTAAPCLVDGCGEAREYLGRCTKHADRWLRWGTTDPEPPQPSQCEADGCTRRRYGPSTPWCRAHITRIRETGALGPGAFRTGPKNQGPCAIGGCPWEVYSDGLCHRHYRLRRTKGDPLSRITRTPDRAGTEPCSVAGCHERGGPKSRLCSTHWQQAYMRGQLPGPECSTEGCTTRVFSHGLCRRHNEAEVRRRQRAERERDGSSRNVRPPLR